MTMMPIEIGERGSKLLAADGFMGDHYELKYSTPAELIRFLEAGPPRIVILDAPDDPPAHLQLVRQTIEEQKNSWQFVSSYPVGDQSPIPNTEIRVYRLQTESTPGGP